MKIGFVGLGSMGLPMARNLIRAGHELAVPMPLASLIHDHYLSELARGRGESDWAALARVSAENAGLGEERTGQTEARRTAAGD